MKNISLLFLVLITLTIKTHAAVFNIANGDVAGLIAAINAANANSEADIINLATNGIYNLTAVNNTISNPNIGGGNGLPAIINSFSGAGADITINGNGATIQRSTTTDLRILVISGSGTEVVINNVIFKNAKATLNGACIAAMWKNVKLTINGCTFENNVLTPVGSNTEDGGGAILIHEGFLTVTNTTFKGNTAPNGGAIKCLLSNMTLTNCTFENNQTTGIGNNGGAGVMIDGAKFDGAAREINISLCKFINNTDIKQGGGLFYYTYGNTIGVVDKCYFKGNTSPSGGGMHAGVDNSSNNNLTISNSTFDSNIASGASGGLNIYSPNPSNFTVTINNSTFAFNQANGGTAGGGGAVANFGSTLSFNNCTIAKNSTNAFGGGIAGHGGSITLKNSIIAENTATNNFGAYGVNNIQRNCASGGFQSNPPPYFVNGGNNLEWPERTDLVNNGLCTPSIAIADPKLDNVVKDNGGPVPTLAILPGSAAINAGASCITTDQRGASRIGTCDIGAFEFGATTCNLVVSSTADSGPNTLRNAIACATSGQTITFAPTLANQTIVLSSTLVIPVGKNLTIDGAAAPNLTISGNNAVRVFLLKSTSVNPTTLNLKNLKIVNGFHTEYGAGIRSEHQGIMNIENCIFNNNNAEEGGSAIFSHFEGRATIINCKFDGNISIAKNTERGSTVMLWGPHAHTVKNCDFTNNRGINGAAINGLNAALTIEDCNFLNNTTTDAFYDTGKPNPFLRGFGGAVYTDRATPATPATLLGSVIIRRSKFEGNRAEGEGGACYLYTDESDNVLIEDCYFNDNEVLALTGGGSEGSGGAIQHMNNAKNKGFVLRNTTFSNNRAGVVAGAVRVDWADTEITNCTFFNNKALLTSSTGTSANGGALSFFFMASSTVTITNSTFANNYAGWVGGAIATSHAANTRIRNNIFFQNTAGNGGNTWNIRQQASEHLTDLGGNIQFPDKANSDPNNRNVSTSVTIANPKLNLMANNGGFAPTMSLQAGSPAINFGVTTGAPTTDQTGAARTGNPDAGAVEFNASALPPALPASIVLGSTPKFSCGMTEAAIAATGAARLTIGSSTYYIGTRQVTSTNQNPIVAKFTGGVLDWCREDYETTGADGRGYGLFWSGADLYAVFSTDGTQGTVAEDYRRFTGNGWLKHYTDGSPGGGGGPKVSIIIKINPATGEGIVGNGTFITARNSSNQTNSLEVRDITLNSSGQLVVQANSWFAPRKTDRTAMAQTGTGGSPYDYTIIFTPDLTTAVCASAVGWDNGTSLDCSGTTIHVPTLPEIQVLDGLSDIADNTGSINFGATVVGVPITKIFTIKNLGNATLILNAPTLPSGFSLVGSFPASIAAGAEAIFQVRLTATAPGSFSGVISFGNNDSDENPFNFTLSGTVGAGTTLPAPIPSSSGNTPSTLPTFNLPPVLSFSYSPQGHIWLRWIFPNGVFGSTSMRIERRKVGQITFHIIGNISASAGNFIDSQTEPAVLYEYRVVSINTRQPDAISNIVRIPTAPRNPIAFIPPPICGQGLASATLPDSAALTYRWYESLDSKQAIAQSRAGETINFFIEQTKTYYLAAVFANLESGRTPIVFTVHALPKANIVSEQRFFCGEGIIQAEQQEGVRYEWKEGEHTVGRGPNLKIRRTGFYTLWVSNANCSFASEPIRVEVQPIPQARILEGADVSFCEKGTLTAQNIPGASYEWTNEKGDIIANQVICEVRRSGVYRLRVRQNSCVSEAVSIKVNINPLPLMPPIFHTKIICEGTALELSTASIEGATYEWTGPNGFKATTAKVQLPYNENLTGFYNLQIKVNGCASPINSAWIEVSRPIRFAVQPMPPQCTQSADGYLQVLNFEGQDLNFQLKEKPNLVLQNSRFNGLKAGIYTITATNKAGCSLEQRVELTSPTDFEVQVNESKTISRFTSVQLEAKGAERYEWFPKEGLNNPYIAKPIAKPSISTTYKVVGYNSRGCEKTAETTVNVIDEHAIKVQKVVSPNGDGYNDTFYIKDVDQFPQAVLVVYNRVGQKIFEGRSYQNNWDVSSLPDGTYYYVLQLSPQKTLTGTITVIR